jgi:ADP-ribosylglycohydrolase
VVVFQVSWRLRGNHNKEMPPMKLWTKDVWLHLSKRDLRVEMDQCRDEGKDLSKVQAEFDALLADDQDEEDMGFQARAGKLLDKSARLRPKSGHPYKEPSDLAGIRKARRGRVKLPQADLGDQALLDKALGAWQGRSAGCLCGKTVEGRTRQQIEAYLKHQGRWPLSFYFSNKADEAVRKANNFREPSSRCYVENINCMVEDDDTNDTATGLAVVERCGKDFTPADVGRFWMGNIPILHTCTAERVAYRNLVSLVGPPGPDGKLDGPFSSATYRNPYREWIGAQIRADFFGYVNPANPERAAEYAWRDAAISHIKNGMYGEMWAAAMLAAACAVSQDVEKVIRAGMGEIPAKSRLHEDLTTVLDWHKSGIGYWEAIDRLHARWDQMNGHHWCHTNSNAQIVAIALLWGGRDLGKTVCCAVMPGFDTDCNAATAGSVLGLMLGAKGLPAEWISPMNDTLETGVAGYHNVRLSFMAQRTLELIRRDQQQKA